MRPAHRFLLLTVILSAACQARAQGVLPGGPGKEAVTAACIGCHEASRLIGSGYTPQDWRNIVAMMRNVGAPIPPEQVDTITNYLSTNFPPKPQPPAVALAGTAEVATAGPAARRRWSLSI